MHRFTIHGVRAGLGVASVATVFLAGCGSTAASTGSAPTPTPASTVAAPAGPQNQVVLNDFSISTGAFHSGAITFMVRNAGRTPHNFTLEDSTGRVVVATNDLNEGQTASVSTTLVVGSYMYLCTQPGHASLGMMGMVQVTS